ncbi:MAG: hypothetical protein R3E12_04420 [Candidatus Eisenbacteria bacterium]
MSTPVQRSKLSLLMRLSTRVGFCCVVLVLPLGFQPTVTDSSTYAVGAFGGTGEAVAVLRGCSGEVLDSQTVAFREGSVSIAATQHHGRGSRTVVGVRGGVLTVPQAPVPDKSSRSLDETRRETFSYGNPYVSAEQPSFGIGIGLMINPTPANVRELGGPDPLKGGGSSTKVPISGHLRFGPSDRAYLMLSLAENTPLYTAGLWNVGLGYQAGRYAHLFTGLSAGFYDQKGFLQQAAIRLPGQPIELQGSMRFGGSTGKSEVAGSMGLVYTP